jgi:hypothetical protein
VAFADTGAVSSLINLKDEETKEDAAREPPPGTRVPVALSLRSLLWPFADTGAVSSLINLKDEKMKEDAAREPPPDTRIPVALSLRSLLWPSPILALYLLSLI